ncbi:AraC family transcriptional regulator [Pectinatus brassicae]|uniref:AraC-like DNA-binding protein/mannose-6-phosphate isomerase-like protein (Cupin superfamily) n=1 Tax=Pectinatus brassicae TaxID=862415 RepID=A0A840UCW9_9FIRM|nr:AraC family transcriptional regulator [Pectinatus brassicae]MBB5335571.1 AraC-like DNA-binding protein/mannose-6-phosphate isomerase-like protein (cupin superfamily) [Pectinatus brassicae]
MKDDSFNEVRQRGRFDFPIEFHYVDYNHPRFNMPYHWHIEYEIMYLIDGEFSISLNETEIKMTPGSFLFIPDGVVHGGVPVSKNCVYECIVIDINKLLKDNIVQHSQIEAILNHELYIINYFDDSHPAIQKILKNLFIAMHSQKTGYEFIVTGMLYSFIGEILKNQLYHKNTTYSLAINRHHICQIKQAFNLINTQYALPLTLNDLSTAAGLSPNYFCKFFQKMTHRTPIDYLNYYRIEIACQKLSSSDLSITDIAYSTGFNDLSYFIKIFKRYKGISPRKYQKQLTTITYENTFDKHYVIS